MKKSLLQRFSRCLALALLLLPLQLFARDFTYTYEGQSITYTVLNEEAKTCSTKLGENINFNYQAGNKVSGDLVLPEHPKDGDVEFTLVSIGEYAFVECFNLTSVSIPNSVTSIGKKAFYKCPGLKKAEFASVEFLCNIEFQDQYSNPLSEAHSLYINGEEITKLVIPNSVESIGGYAFFGCSGLTSVTIPNSVTRIGNYAFEACSGLKKAEFASIESLCNIRFESTESNPLRNAHHLYINGEEVTELVIPNSVTSIGNYAFVSCSGLISVEIPNSVTSIGKYAFLECSGLTSIIIEDGSDPISLGYKWFPNLKNLYIGRNFTWPNANKSFFDNLIIGNLVTKIPASTFEGCTSIKSLKLGSGLTAVGNLAFKGCTGLKEVIIPENVESIGTSAFANIPTLASIIMGHSVKSIGEKAFDGAAASTVSITAPEPPVAPNNTFSNYTGKLYVQGEGTAEKYYDAYTCWDRFDSYVMITADKIEGNNDTAIKGKPGQQVQLVAKVWPENATLQQVFWRSTNPEIATVDNNGLVTFHASPENILARSGSSCKIIAETLYADGPVLEFDVESSEGDTLPEAISLNATAKELTVGETFALVATVTPEDTTDKTVTWTSSDATIASVDTEGNVTALALGETVITATCGSVFANCKVTVIPTPAESVTLDFSSWQGKVGEKVQLKATVLPESATDKTITWKSADASIASVDADGNVTALALGETVITASCGSVSATCKVTVIPTLVESISINPTEWTGNEGEKFTIVATVLPDDATDKTLDWSSSDTAIAEVDADGNVTVLKAGTCKITVTTTDGSNLSADCIITSTSGISDILIDANEPFDVYNMSGLRLRENTTTLDGLAPGIYIIRQGSAARKIVIK